MTFQVIDRDNGKKKLQPSGILHLDKPSTIHKSLILCLLPEKYFGEDFVFHFFCFMNGLSLFVEKGVSSVQPKVLFHSNSRYLVALRILERNNTADDTNELIGGPIGESTCNEI